jgi:uncharacterized Fe-S cluster protein YjdI
MTSAHRDYRTEDIVVHWRAELCIHSARCVRALPAVFTPQERPWIHVERASADQVADAVRRCPTGALQYTRLDGGVPETSNEEVTVTPVTNGPLYVSGAVRVVTEAGTVLAEGTRVALCRCGQTRNAPFCDNSHREAGFRA